MNTYLVKSGDTLSALAPALLGPGGTTVQLMIYNAQITDPNVIEVGDVIYYPASSSSVSDTTDVSDTSSDDSVPLLQNPITWIGALAAVIIGATLYLTSKKRKN